MPVQVQCAVCVGRDQLVQHASVRTVPYHRAVWSWIQCWDCLPCRIHTPRAGSADSCTGLSQLGDLHGINRHDAVVIHEKDVPAMFSRTPNSMTWLKMQYAVCPCLLQPSCLGYSYEPAHVTAAPTGHILPLVSLLLGLLNDAFNSYDYVGSNHQIIVNSKQEKKM